MLLKKIKTHFFIILVLVLAFFLRMHKYGAFPIVGETKDEFAWTFLGTSLLETGTPISWSTFPAYTPMETLTLGQDFFPMVSPSLDHPPLFAFVPGSIHRVLGNSWRDFPSIKVIRFPMILIGILNIFLFYLYVKKTTPELVVKMSVILYATIPYFVFGSRLVIAENFLITLILLSLLIVEYYKQIPKVGYCIAALCTVAMLVKISGIIIPITLVLYALQTKNRKIIFPACVGTFIGLAAFVLYGAFYDWQTFVQVFFIQSGRNIGLATLTNRFFLHPAIIARLVIDGWNIVSIFSLFTYIVMPKHNKMVAIYLLVNLLFILASVGETTFHGWYNYLFFPLFSLTLAHLFNDLYQKQNGIGIWIVWLFLLPAVRMALVHYEMLPESTLHLRMFMLLGGIPLVAALISSEKKYWQYACKFLFAVLIFSNVLAVVTFTAHHYWEDDEYFLPKVVVK